MGEAIPLNVPGSSKPSFVPVSDPPLGKIIWRQFEADTVAHQNTDEVFPHLAGNLGQHDVVGAIEANLEKRVGLLINDDAFSGI